MISLTLAFLGKKFQMAKEYRYTINRTSSKFPVSVPFLTLTLSCFFDVGKVTGIMTTRMTSFLLLQDNLPLIWLNNVESYHENTTHTLLHRPYNSLQISDDFLISYLCNYAKRNLLILTEDHTVRAKDHILKKLFGYFSTKMYYNIKYFLV